MVKPLKILFNEFDEDLRTGLSSYLTHLLPTIVIHEALNSLDAMKILSKEKYEFDIILTDMFIPRITNYQLLNFFRPNNRQIAIIALINDETIYDFVLNKGFITTLKNKGNFHYIVNKLYNIIMSIEKSDKNKILKSF